MRRLSRSYVTVPSPHDVTTAVTAATSAADSLRHPPFRRRRHQQRRHRLVTIPVTTLAAVAVVVMVALAATLTTTILIYTYVSRTHTDASQSATSIARSQLSSTTPTSSNRFPLTVRLLTPMAIPLQAELYSVHHVHTPSLRLIRLPQDTTTGNTAIGGGSSGDGAAVYRPDFGDLKLRFSSGKVDTTAHEQRLLEPNANEDDDVSFVDSYDFLYDEIEWNHSTCMTPTWIYHDAFPVCHFFHERTVLDDSPFLGKGYFRDSWLLHHHFTAPFTAETAGIRSTTGERFEETVVLKRFRYHHPVNAEHFRMVHSEAVIFEATTASERTTRLYGYCGTSLLVEAAHEITFDIVPFLPAIQSKRGRMSHQALATWHRQQQQPSSSSSSLSLNNLTAVAKLDIAIQMAEGLAELHGLSKGVIVNDDVHPDQWLVTSDGRVVLNDMNNAVFLEWNEDDQDYCDYYSSYNGDFRAPEEYRAEGAYVTESADIWPMGNLIYSLLTGLWPYFDLVDEREIQNITLAGVKPLLHPAYRYRSFIERRLTEIMDKCHQLEPEDRVDIFTVLTHLRETKRLYLSQ